MLRRVVRLISAIAALVAALVVLAPGAGPAAAQEPPPPGPTDTVAPIPPPRASIVVDADTGEVITASNEREPLPPASTTKILTALLARDRLDWEGTIGISGTAALAPPRRLRLTAGQQWGVEDLAYAMLHCSCNDAAWALGQAGGGGTMPGFAAQSQILADELGLEDDPVLHDPAGLDDDRSVDGGNLLSARDLAIAARAFLADPELAEIARAEGHEWTGGDGAPHSVTNLNAFLDAYPGAVGIKTGSTQRAGLTFVGAAERDGRTLIAVVLGSQNHYAHARELLDAGFLLAEVDERTGDVLPEVPDTLGDGQAAATTTTTSTTTTTTSTTTTSTAPAPGSDDDPTTTSPDTAAVAASGGDDDGGGGVPVVPVAAGGAVVVLAVGAVVLARRRRAEPGVDTRAAKPRRRDRGRTGWTPPETS